MVNFQVFYESNQIDWDSAYNFYDDGNPVEIDLDFGKLEIAIENLSNGEDALFINDMFINPKYQGMGYGSEILKSAIKYADKNNIYIALRASSGGHYNTQSNLDQEELKKFYIRYGFKLRPELSIFGDDDIFMVREPS